MLSCLNAVHTLEELGGGRGRLWGPSLLGWGREPSVKGQEECPPGLQAAIPLEQRITVSVSQPRGTQADSLGHLLPDDGGAHAQALPGLSIGFIVSTRAASQTQGQQ